MVCAMKWSGKYVGLVKIMMETFNRYCCSRLWFFRLNDKCIENSDGKIAEAEAAHGTVTRHYDSIKLVKKLLQINCFNFAWTRGLFHRGNLDNNAELTKFTKTLEKVCINSENGYMTKDLAILISKDQKFLTTNQFLEAIDSNLKKT